MMGKLAEMLERTTSRDVIHANFEVYHPDKTDAGEIAKGGPIKEKVDLSYFLDFTSYERRTAGSGKWLCVDKRGTLRLSSELVGGQETLRTRIYANKPGTIIVIKPDDTGRIFKRSRGKGKALQITCKTLQQHLIEKNIPLPARYNATWDDELQAWVGRR
ncbi:MAG: hypothetical protein ACPLRU_01140 [Desulfofundulus sp.]